MLFREQSNAVEGLVSRFGHVMHVLGAYYPDRPEYDYLIARYFKIAKSEAATCPRDYIEKTYSQLQSELLKQLLEKTAARYVLERERVICYEAYALHMSGEAEIVAHKALMQGHPDLAYDANDHAEVLRKSAQEFGIMRDASIKNVEALSSECAMQLAQLVEWGDTSLEPIQCVADARAYKPPHISIRATKNDINERHYANALGVCLADVDIARIRMEMAETNVAYLLLTALSGHAKDDLVASLLMNKRQQTVNFADSNGFYMDVAAQAVNYVQASRDEMISERYDRSRLYVKELRR